MDKDEILEKASSKKVSVGEAEKKGISKSGLISLLITGIFAVAMIVIEGALGHFSAVYAIAAACFLWASVFYFLQYFVAQRKFFGIVVGAVLEGLAFAFFLTRYILFVTGVWC